MYQRRTKASPDSSNHQRRGAVECHTKKHRSKRLTASLVVPYGWKIPVRLLEASVPFAGRNNRQLDFPVYF
ncbi:hypothetical protein SOVF_148660 [Spinacia oleracea]|nr:hypothetical protein SOVF_148660 [Spinacia oleracea]